MVTDTDDVGMTALLIILAVVAFFAAAVVFGADSRHDEPGRHRTNLL